MRKPKEFKTKISGPQKDLWNSSVFKFKHSWEQMTGLCNKHFFYFQIAFIVFDKALNYYLAYIYYFNALPKSLVFRQFVTYKVKLLNLLNERFTTCYCALHNGYHIQDLASCCKFSQNLCLDTPCFA